MANSSFAELKESHVLVRLDTKNGKSNVCDELGVSIDTSYVILMKLSRFRWNTWPDGESYHPAEEVAKLTGPASLDTIFGLARLVGDQAAEK